MIEVLSGSISAAIEYGNIKKYPVLYLPIKEDIPRINLVDPDKASILGGSSPHITSNVWLSTVSCVCVAI